MKNIVERLRSAEFADVGPKYLMWEAAEEIERLRGVSKDKSVLLRDAYDQIDRLEAARKAPTANGE